MNRHSDAFLRSMQPMVLAAVAATVFLATLQDGAAQDLTKLSEEKLNKVTRLTPEQALSLAPVVSLYLDGLTELSVVSAKHLGQPKTRGLTLSLGGLKKLSPEVAFALTPGIVPCKRQNLELNGVTKLTPEVARILAKHSGVVCLDSVTELPPDVARALAEQIPEAEDFGGFIQLNGVKSLSAESAKGIASRYNRLDLNGVVSLSAAAAKALATHQGYGLHLMGLTQLDEDAARWRNIGAGRCPWV
jgi:hypothetical protein